MLLGHTCIWFTIPWCPSSVVQHYNIDGVVTVDGGQKLDKKEVDGTFLARKLTVACTRDQKLSKFQIYFGAISDANTPWL